MNSTIANLLALTTIVLLGTSCTAPADHATTTVTATQTSTERTDTATATSSTTDSPPVKSSTNKIDNPDFSVLLPTRFGQFEVEDGKEEQNGTFANTKLYMCKSGETGYSIAKASFDPKRRFNLRTEAVVQKSRDGGLSKTEGTLITRQPFTYESWPAEADTSELRGGAVYGRHLYIASPPKMYMVTYVSPSQSDLKSDETNAFFSSLKLKVPPPKKLTGWFKDGGKFFSIMLPKSMTSMVRLSSTPSEAGAPGDYMSTHKKFESMLKIGEQKFPSGKFEDQQKALDSVATTTLSQLKAEPFRKVDFLYQGKYPAIDILYRGGESAGRLMLVCKEPTTVYRTLYYTLVGDDAITQEMDDIYDSVTFTSLAK